LTLEVVADIGGNHLWGGKACCFSIQEEGGENVCKPWPTVLDEAGGYEVWPRLDGGFLGAAKVVNCVRDVWAVGWVPGSGQGDAVEGSSYHWVVWKIGFLDVED
jgi:hypothetical protein